MTNKPIDAIHRRSAAQRAAGPAIVLLTAAGCVGNISSPERWSGAGAPEPPGGTLPPGGEIVLPPNVATPPAACATAPVAPGLAPMRRLNRFEYDNTVRDLLGDGSRPAQRFPEDPKVGGFDNDANALVLSDLLIEGYVGAAADLASRATQDLGKLLPCDPAAAGEDACARTFIAAFGRRAWRRPLDDEERQRYFQLYRSDAQATFRERVQMIVEALLASPNFYFRPEVGAGGAGVVKLDGYEIATRLSYLLWSSMPDEALLDAAESGRLTDPVVVAEHAARLLREGRARAALAHANRSFWGIDGLGAVTKDEAAVGGGFSGRIHLPLFQTEMERFIEHVIWEDDGKLSTLLSAPYTFVNRPLATYYGQAGGLIPPFPPNDAFAKIGTDPTKRAGLLTQGGLMTLTSYTNNSNPVKRGLFVRTQFLCSAPPPPPPNVDATPPRSDPTLTTRERFDRHRTDPACNGCHALLDPIGLGFEHYDAVGRWRDSENGKVIDARGEIVASDGDDPSVLGAFDGVAGLAGKLAGSRQPFDCMAGHWFRFAYGRTPAPGDACAVAALAESFATAEGRFLDLLTATTQLSTFYYRTNEGGTP